MLATCKFCKNEMETECCWCGIDIENHQWETHSFHPIGCTCGFEEKPKEQAAAQPLLIAPQREKVEQPTLPIAQRGERA